jgi:hypothetical protein
MPVGNYRLESLIKEKERLVLQVLASKMGLAFWHREFLF